MCAFTVELIILHTLTCSASYPPSTDHQTLTRSSGQHLDIQSSYTDLFCLLSTINRSSNTNQVLRSTSGHPEFCNVPTILQFYFYSSPVLQFYFHRSTSKVLQIYFYSSTALQIYRSTSTVIPLYSYISTVLHFYFFCSTFAHLPSHLTIQRAGQSNIFNSHYK